MERGRVGGVPAAGMHSVGVVWFECACVFVIFVFVFRMRMMVGLVGHTCIRPFPSPVVHHRPPHARACGTRWRSNLVSRPHDRSISPEPTCHGPRLTCGARRDGFRLSSRAFPNHAGPRIRASQHSRWRESRHTLPAAAPGSLAVLADGGARPGWQPAAENSSIAVCPFIDVPCEFDGRP